MGDRAKEAFGITATLFVLFFFGQALGDGMGQYLDGPGFLALALTFAAVYLAVLLWVVWYYRRR
jgi:hypothetical protein